MSSRQRKKLISDLCPPGSLGERIEKARKQKGFSQGDLAKAVGIGLATVARYEQGKGEPSAYKLAQIAAVLEVSTSHLLGEEVRESSPAWGSGPPNEPLSPEAAELLAAWASIQDPARREQARRFVLFLLDEEKRKGGENPADQGG